MMYIRIVYPIDRITQLNEELYRLQLYSRTVAESGISTCHNNPNMVRRGGRGGCSTAAAAARGAELGLSGTARDNGAAA